MNIFKENSHLLGVHMTVLEAHPYRKWILPFSAKSGIS